MCKGNCKGKCGDKCKCKHPDHNEREDCRDRAIACAPTCACCLDEATIKFYGNKSQSGE